MVKEGDLLWQPREDFKHAANVSVFMRWLGAHRGLEFRDYEALRRWSVGDIAGFWQALWGFYEVESSAPHECVLKTRAMPGAQWFPGARVNFARHVMRAGRPGEVAIHAMSELRPPTQLTFEDLGVQVRKLATALRALGVRPGDRVVAYMPSIPETAVAMLATTSIGAVWSCCSPDFGIKSVLDRFSQIDPVVIFAVDGYRYGGRDFDRREQVGQLIAGLPTVARVITVPYLHADEAFSPVPGAIDWSAIQTEETAVPADPFEFEDTAFDQPLWIVYSSGTTGLPKSFVHGHGGVLLEVYKFCGIHLNLGPNSVALLFSTTGWVTWNILVGSMMTGSSVVFYDGNPTAPDVETLWRICEHTGTTFMGTSPAFVSPLFVTLAEGCELTDDLRERINGALRSYSPRHVPDRIYHVAASPYTLTGKKMEVPVRKILLGMSVDQAANVDAMAEPRSIEYFVNFAHERRDYQLG